MFGMLRHFSGRLRNRHTFLQFFKPIQANGLQEGRPFAVGASSGTQQLRNENGANVFIRAVFIWTVASVFIRR